MEIYNTMWQNKKMRIGVLGLWEKTAFGEGFC